MRLHGTLVLLLCLALIADNAEAGKKNRGSKKKNNKKKNRPSVTTTTGSPTTNRPLPVHGSGSGRLLVKADRQRHLSQQNGPLPAAGRVRGARPEEGVPVAHGLNTASGPNRLSDEEKAIFLDAHNQFRSEVQPTAANMLEMEWDDSLASMAQGWADRCIFGHGNPENSSPFEYVGQNIWAGSGPQDYWNHYDMVKSWNDEKEFYDYSSNTCSSVCGHYTQIVWAETTHVGCALASCQTLHGVGWSPGTLLVCNYGEGGNYVGEKPYRRGEPCSRCPSGYDTCVRAQLCSSGSEDDPSPPNNFPGGQAPNVPGNNLPDITGVPSDPEITHYSYDVVAVPSAAYLESPNFPQPYDYNIAAEWTIRGESGRRISMDFLFMSMEDSSQCVYDYLVVSAEDINPTKYCGTTLPAPIISSSSRVYVQMVSDTTVNGGGFRLKYRLLDVQPEEEDQSNGVHVVTGPKGTIKSPGYPKNPYLNNVDVKWIIRVTEGKRVRLQIKSMDIEHHPACQYDSLSIRLGTEIVPMRLCGSDIVAGKAYYFSLTNEMEIHFKSDTQVTADGFDLRWKAVG